MKHILLIVLTLISLTAYAQHDGKGNEGGGGGDPTEATVFDIRESILNWIKAGDAKDLVFKNPTRMNYDRYVKAMKDILIAPPDSRAVVVTFVTTQQESLATSDEQKVNIDGQGKTCRSFKSKIDLRKHILCNSDRWPESSSAQFRLIHHEFAGLAKVETNVGAASDYEFSNQLADFGQIVRVYKLGPKRTGAQPTVPSRKVDYVPSGSNTPITEFSLANTPADTKAHLARIKGWIRYYDGTPIMFNATAAAAPDAVYFSGTGHLTPQYGTDQKITCQYPIEFQVTRSTPYLVTIRMPVEIPRNLNPDQTCPQDKVYTDIVNSWGPELFLERRLQ